MPQLGGAARAGQEMPVTSPVDRSRVVGTVLEATTEDVDAAFEQAVAAQRIWDVLLYTSDAADDPLWLDLGCSCTIHQNTC